MMTVWPGHGDSVRQMGRRAAANGSPVTLIDDYELFDAEDRQNWRAGWTEKTRELRGLSLVVSNP